MSDCRPEFTVARGNAFTGSTPHPGPFAELHWIHTRQAVWRGARELHGPGDMRNLLQRCGLLSAGVFFLPGCLEVALIQALDHDDEEVSDEAYTGERGPDDALDFPAVSDPDTSWETTSALDVRGATLQGSMGNIRDFWDEEATYSGYDYGTYATLDVHADAPDGAAMAILQVQGSFDHPDLQPGAHFELAGYEETPGGLSLTVVGCSGPSEGAWDFDASADRTEVDVSQTLEGTRILDFAATFADGQTTTGSVELGALQAQ